MTQNHSLSQKTKTREKSKAGNEIATFQDAFIHELSDMHSAERQLTKALLKMAKAASDSQLAKAFETHFKETQHQIELIDKAVKSSGIKLKREKCEAMESLIEEGKEIIKNVEEGAVRDSMLIAAAQKVEHYEIASYGCLVSAARRLGFSEAAEFLDQILDQEKQTDRKLNQLAEAGINAEAFMQDSTQKGTNMAQYDRENGNGRRGRMPERDDEGRFMSDDDNRDYGRGQYYSDDRSSSRYDRDDDDRRYSRSSRDDDYNDDNYSSSSRDRDYEDDYDDNRSSSGRGHGGWFGDSEGHAEAARQRGRGGNHRSSSSRSSSRYDNDDRYSSRSGGNGGRRMSHSNQSSRSGSRSSGQGRGWFGDPEGHARAGRHSHDNERSGSRR